MVELDLNPASLAAHSLFHCHSKPPDHLPMAPKPLSGKAEATLSFWAPSKARLPTYVGWLFELFIGWLSQREAANYCQAALSQELYSHFLPAEDSVLIKQTKKKQTKWTKLCKRKSFAESSPLNFASSFLVAYMDWSSAGSFSSQTALYRAWAQVSEELGFEPQL